MMKKWILLCVVFVLTLAGCGDKKDNSSETTSSNGSGTVTYKLAHIAPQNHIWNDAAEKFKEEVEAGTDGRVKIDIFPGGQLGSDADMVQQIESGALDFAFITNAYLTSKSDAFSAWFAPFLFDSYEEALEASRSDESLAILETINGNGIKPLNLFFSGMRTMMFTEKIETPEQMKGLTLRVTPSPALEDWYRSLGANPESISLPDVYQAAQTGIIDGMEMDLDAAVTSNFNEVTGYGALTNHMVWPSIMIANEKLFNGLDEADQKIVEEAMATASEYATLKRASEEEEFMDILSERGMELYDMDEALFDEYKEQFDKKYRSQDPIIDNFIGKFRK